MVKTSAGDFVTFDYLDGQTVNPNGQGNLRYWVPLPRDSYLWPFFEGLRWSA
jgi:hypothetical protein